MPDPSFLEHPLSDPLIIVGDVPDDATTSAQRAGYAPIVLSPDNVLKEINRTPSDAAVLLTGEMENGPELVAAIASQRTLLGSGADAIRAVRDPAVLPSLPGYHGLRFCRTTPRVRPWQRLVRKIFGGRTYLIKPRDSFGGRGIRPWASSSRVGPDEYIQQAITGTPMSAVYRSDGWSCALLGVTEQLVGEPKLGASWYQYCGSIGPVFLDDSARKALSHLGVVLTQRHDLRGVFGVDLMRDRRSRWWPLEVNPRWPASAAVLELSLGGSLLRGKLTATRAAVQYGIAWNIRNGRRTQPVQADGPDRAACFASLLDQATRRTPATH